MAHTTSTLVPRISGLAHATLSMLALCSCAQPKTERGDYSGYFTSASKDSQTEGESTSSNRTTNAASYLGQQGQYGGYDFNRASNQSYGSNQWANGGYGNYGRLNYYSNQYNWWDDYSQYRRYGADSYSSGESSLDGLQLRFNNPASGASIVKTLGDSGVQKGSGYTVNGQLVRGYNEVVTLCYAAQDKNQQISNAAFSQRIKLGIMTNLNGMTFEIPQGKPYGCLHLPVALIFSEYSATVFNATFYAYDRQQETVLLAVGISLSLK